MQYGDDGVGGKVPGLAEVQGPQASEDLGDGQEQGVGQLKAAGQVEGGEGGGGGQGGADAHLGHHDALVQDEGSGVGGGGGGEVSTVNGVNTCHLGQSRACACLDSVSSSSYGRSMRVYACLRVDILSVVV